MNRRIFGVEFGAAVEHREHDGHDRAGRRSRGTRRFTLPGLRARRARGAARSGGGREPGSRVLGGLAVFALVFSAVGIVDVARSGDAPAFAASTPVSDFSKVGTNQTHPSTASLGSPGTANPGDTIQWVLSYRNKAGADASVSINDPITAGQSYVANSLRLPPSLTGSVSGGVLSASGTMPTGTTSAQIPLSTPVSIDFNTPGGDGYSIENFGTNIYTVYHHASGGAVVFCATVANTRCANWPAGQYASYVSPTAGTAIGTGAAPSLVTAGENGSFIVNGKLYWGVESTVAVNGRYQVGVMCLDLTVTPARSCGLTSLGTIALRPINNGALLSTNGVPAADGNYYLFDGDGNMLCFSPSTGACGSVNVTGGLRTTNAGTGTVGASGWYNASVLTSGNYVFATYVTSVPTSTTLYLTCYDVTTHAACPGYQINEGAAPYGPGPDTLAPILDANGVLTGVCDLGKHLCYSPTGATMPNPYPATMTGTSYAGFAAGFGDGAIVGSKFYATMRTDVVICWDFAAPLVNGQVQRCSGFTGKSNPSNYTTRALAGDLEGCGASDGDAGRITIFNLSNGGGCNAIQAVQVAVTPSQYYCDGQAGHAVSWGAVTLQGLSASDYGSARLTLTDANGNNVSGWVDVPFPATGAQSIDISSIPVSGTTASLTAHVTIVGATNPSRIASSQLVMGWVGDAIQVCYRTAIAPVACLSAPVPVSDQATAVTTSGTTTDSPSGNSTGTVTFLVSNTAAACMLHLSKTASPAPAKPGDTVTYTITVTNTGTSAYGSANPATFSDSIAAVLLDASYNAGSLTASAGTASYDAATRVVSWSGPLGAGASSTITYTVTVNDPDTGPHSMTNRVVTPTGTPSNCPAGSTDPACRVTVPIQSFRVVKDTTATEVLPGGVVVYTVTVTNSGHADYTAGAPASLTDDLSGVLDDATYNGDATATGGTVGYAAPVLSWSGPLAVGASVTITYSVTVNTPDTGNAQLSNTVVTPAGSGGNCAAGSTDPSCHVDVPEKSFHVAKSTSASVTEAGRTIVYTLTVTNTGQSAYTTGSPASLQDNLAGVLDDAVYNNDADSSAGSLAYAGSVLSWSGALAVGASVTITYSVTVHDPDTGDHLLDNAVTSPPGSGGNCVAGSTDPACRSVVPVRSYTVAKSSAASGTVYPGEVVSYTITITNTGAAAYTLAAPATASDDLTAVLDDAGYNGDAAASAGTVSYAAPTLAWSGPLDVGAVATVTYTVTVGTAPTGDGTMTNAAIPSGPGGQCADGNAPNCAPVVLQVGRYTVAKTSTSTGAVHPGETITYTITVHNPSRGDFTSADPASFTDDLTAVLDDATYNGDAMASAGAVSFASPQLTWSGALPAGATATVTYTVTVRDTTTGDHVLTNAADPTTAGGSCADGSAAPCPPVVLPVQSFTVAKSASTSGPLHAGSDVTYTITVANTGAVDYTTLAPARFTDDMSNVVDDGTYNDDATTTSGTLDYQAPALTWQGALPVGATVTVTYTVTSRPDAGDHSLMNRVTTPTGLGGTCQEGSSDTDCTVTIPVYGLHVQKTVNTAMATDGQTLTYTITVTNTGNADFTQADPAAFRDDLTDVLNGAVYGNDATATAGTTSYTSPVLSWTGPLTVGARATITFTVTVKNAGSAVFTLMNTVATTSDGNCGPGSGDPACRAATTVMSLAPTGISGVNGYLIGGAGVLVGIGIAFQVLMARRRDKRRG